MQGAMEGYGMGRIRGLDALRFLCALCVVQGHLRLGGYLVLDKLHGSGMPLHMIKVAFNQGFPIPTGPNAVIVFFVISGFCIHFPYAHQKTLNFSQFLVRRYVRVGLPAILAAVLLYNTGFHSLPDSVLWSVICEIIYYTIYPLLMAFKQRFGWKPLLVAAYGAAYVTIALHQGGRYNGDFTSLGVTFTWILGLPCWLLGCILAESHRRFRSHGRARQWAFRLGMVSLAAVATTLRFYAGIGYFWTQPLLAIAIYGWLGTEIAYFSRRRPWQWLEWCGSWSYSVYLYHAPLALFIANTVLPRLRPGLDMTPKLLLEVGTLLVGSYLLSRMVEKPAHELARRYTGPARWLRLARAA
jgi:peptidoglycan/LPS O-acetylase OafA/YrhL